MLAVSSLLIAVLANIASAHEIAFAGERTLTTAAATMTTDDGIEYESNEGVVTIKKYSGEASFVDLSRLNIGTITQIGDYAFDGCTNLVSVTFPATLQRIEDNAFRGCTSLRSLTLPENLTYIDAHAFRNCTSLSSVTVKSRSLGVYGSYYGIFENAGTGTSSGIAATFEPSCKAVPAAMFAAQGGAPKLASVVMKEGVKTLGDYAFQGCTCLKSVSLPTSLESIGQYAFCDCNELPSIRIPQNVAVDGLGYNAFVNIGLSSIVTATTGEQFNKLKGNPDYITITRTTVALASNSLYRSTVSGLSNKAFTGKQIKPVPTVKMGSTTLRNGKDFTVSYKDNKALGIATITVSGKGEYVGTQIATFKIVPAKVTGVKAKAYKGRTATVKWSKKLGDKAGVSGYRVYLKISGKKKAQYYNMSSWRSDTSFYNLPKGKKATFKVQAYTSIDGKRVYGAWSAAKTVKIKK